MRIFLKGDIDFFGKDRIKIFQEFGGLSLFFYFMWFISIVKLINVFWLIIFLIINREKCEILNEIF